VISLKLSNVEMMNRLLIRHKKQLALDTTVRKLGIKEDELEEAEEMPMETGMALQNQSPKNEIGRNSASNAMGQQKREEQEKIAESRGKPQGS